MAIRRKASRLDLVGTSPTIAVKMEADRLRREGVEVIDFGPGEPDLASPAPVKKAAIRAVEDDFSHYTAASGIPDLRKAIAEHYSASSSARIAAEEVLVGVGGKSVLFSAMMSLLNPGDEVAVFSPYWVSFPEQVRLAGASPVFAALSAADGFTIRAEAVERVLTPATTMIIVNSPSNPSGGLIPEPEARRLARIAVERDLWLVSDETYESFVYDEARGFSFLRLREELGERLLFVSAFSKSWAMTGWRVGYAIAAPAVIKAMLTVQSHDTTHACSISQAAALAALRDAATAPAEALELFRGRRELLVEGLRRLDGIDCVPPSGTFYAFPDVSGLVRAKGLSGSAELAQDLLRRVAIATVPGESFGCPGHLRLSYATAEENLREGLRRLERYIEG